MSSSPITRSQTLGPPDFEGTEACGRSTSTTETTERISHYTQSPSLTKTPSVKSRVSVMQSMRTIGSSRRSYTSPGLEQLRTTPGGALKAKQRVLIQKHNEARHDADNLTVGGGVCIWPDMGDMRLSRKEIIQLFLTSFFLIFVVIQVFIKLHGHVIEKLSLYTNRLEDFSIRHPILFSNQHEFDQSLVRWHQQYNILNNEIREAFTVRQLSPSYLLYFALYIACLASLLYHLIENMFSKNKLSPRRIKIWVSLLVVVTVWSAMIMYLLIKAQNLEAFLEQNVLSFNDKLGDAIHKDMSNTKLVQILYHWQLRLLPPTTRGSLHVLGFIAVRDVSHYLQYYSVPVITVIVTPPVRLFIALYKLYVS